VAEIATDDRMQVRALSGRTYPVVMPLRPRRGVRPRTSTTGPHCQLDQQAPPELWGRLVYEAFRLPHVVEGRSQVSPAASRALLLDDVERSSAPEASLAYEPPAEPAHLHGVTDTSMHLCLPAQRAKEVCDAGWGEPHGYADHDTEIMVYGPRDDAELVVVLALLSESVTFARYAGASHA